MRATVSKSMLKPRLLRYLREVELHRHDIVVTDRGRPVAMIVPFVEEPESEFLGLRGTLVRYDKPTEPVGEDDWEATR